MDKLLILLVVVTTTLAIQSNQDNNGRNECTFLSLVETRRCLVQTKGFLVDYSWAMAQIMKLKPFLKESTMDQLQRELYQRQNVTRWDYPWMGSKRTGMNPLYGVTVG